MLLYILRHAEAEALSPSGLDADRALTDAEVAQASQELLAVPHTSQPDPHPVYILAPSSTIRKSGQWEEVATWSALPASGNWPAASSAARASSWEEAGMAAVSARRRAASSDACGVGAVSRLRAVSETLTFR